MGQLVEGVSCGASQPAASRPRRFSSFAFDAAPSSHDKTGTPAFSATSWATARQSRSCTMTTGSCVFDDRMELSRGQAPVERHEDRAEPHARELNLEHPGVVLGD